MLDRPARTGVRTALSDLRARLEQEMALEGSGVESSFLDQGHEAVMRAKAENELNEIADIEEFYHSMGRGSARAAAVRTEVINLLSDLDKVPPEVFQMMCRMQGERDRRLLAELRRATDHSRFPAHIQAEMVDPIRRTEFLSHLELGIPFWQLEAKLERESRLALRMKEEAQREAMGSDAARSMRGPRYGDD